MAKGNDDGSQLKLDLSAKLATVEKAPLQVPRAPVVPFVDSATRRLRTDAINRVANAGIFELPVGLKFR